MLEATRRAVLAGLASLSTARTPRERPRSEAGGKPRTTIDEPSTDGAGYEFVAGAVGEFESDPATARFTVCNEEETFDVDVVVPVGAMSVHLGFDRSGAEAFSDQLVDAAREAAADA